MKHILLTAVGGSDPYTAIKKSDGKIEYNDGSILQIIRRFKKTEHAITDVYLYFSVEMAVSECRTNGIKKAINYLDSTIKLHYFPENIIEETKKLCDKENQNLTNRDMYIAIKDKVNVGRTDVNKFGSFYSEIYEIIYKIKYETKEDYEVFFNVASGTSAMEADINLIGITNKEVLSTLVQVSGPTDGSNERIYKMPITLAKEEMEKLSEYEENAKNRVDTEEAINTKKLILQKSLEDSFKKHDYIGAYNAIEQSKEILKNPKIFWYIQNLYERFIGNEKKALEAEKKIVEYGLSQGKVKDIVNLYPTRKDKDVTTVIEKLNIMKIKEERNEFNDWVLISTPMIEKISKMLFEYNNIKISEFTYKNRNGDEKISIRSFENGKLKNNQNLKTVVEKHDGDFLSAYVLLEIMEILLNKPEILKRFKRVDTTRPYRIKAAHDLVFVSKEEFEANREKDLRDGNKKIDAGTEKTRTAQVYKDIKELMKYIYLLKPNTKEQDFEDACQMYQKIENTILALLQEEIETRI